MSNSRLWIGAFDRRKDCMYLYFTEKKAGLARGFTCLSTSFTIVGVGMCHTFICQCGQEKCCFRFQMEAFGK